MDFENDLQLWQRGEKLKPEPGLEYAGHGHYRMDEGAQNGLYGWWWFDFELKELVRAFNRALVTEKVEEFLRARSLASGRRRWIAYAKRSQRRTRSQRSASLRHEP